MDHIVKVTPVIVKEAVKHLKSKKSDPSFQFSSDCLMHTPDLLYEHLAMLFRLYLTHRHINDILMLATLMK